VTLKDFVGRRALEEGRETSLKISRTHLMKYKEPNHINAKLGITHKQNLVLHKEGFVICKTAPQCNVLPGEDSAIAAQTTSWR
jgi:hypothetical protein